ncbi:hypothetical protein R3P38DRAFT_651199 [Favolaschia claudopus]|uniref:Uncharacterized protein n=1 Tax=Favolaschia claudopus TaxID=2862362 RepID=A0AAW0EAB8_9AGAR
MKTIFALWVLSFTVSALGAALPETNARRFARGLPPLPSVRRTLRGAKRADPSSLPRNVARNFRPLAAHAPAVVVFSEIDSSSSASVFSPSQQNSSGTTLVTVTGSTPASSSDSALPDLASPSPSQPASTSASPVQSSSANLFPRAAIISDTVASNVSSSLPAFTSSSAPAPSSSDGPTISSNAASVSGSDSASLVSLSGFSPSVSSTPTMLSSVVDTLDLVVSSILSYSSSADPASTPGLSSSASSASSSPSPSSSSAASPAQLSKWSNVTSSLPLSVPSAASTSAAPFSLSSFASPSISSAFQSWSESREPLDCQTILSILGVGLDCSSIPIMSVQVNAAVSSSAARSVGSFSSTAPLSASSSSSSNSSSASLSSSMASSIRAASS